MESRFVAETASAITGSPTAEISLPGEVANQFVPPLLLRHNSSVSAYITCGLEGQRINGAMKAVLLYKSGVEA